MTTIAAKVRKDGKVDIAWDARTTAGNLFTDSTVKVRTVNDQFAFGSSGSSRWGNIIDFTDIDAIHPAEFSSGDFDPEHYLVTEVVRKWMKVVDEQSKSWTDDKDDYPWGMAIIAIAGKIFVIHANYAVVDHGDSWAIGSGSPYARAAMYLGKSPLQAVKIATELDLFSGGEPKGLTI